MKKKFTFLMTACIMLLTMMVLPGKAVGQVPTTSDLEWPTPSVSEDFDDLTEVSNTGPTGNSGQTYTDLTAYGIFNKIYLGKSAGHVYAIEDNDDFGSNVYKLQSNGTSYLIAAVTTQSANLGTTGAFSVKIGKTNDGYFGLYGTDDTNLSNKSKNVVYFRYNGTSLQLYNSSSSGSTTTTIGSNYTTDVIEICVIYNNTTSATTYGNAIPLAAKTAHVYINGNCVMNGNSPMACTLPGNNMSCFRFCTNNQANKVMTIDDLKIYNSLPTAPQAAVATPTFTQVSGRTDYNIITEDIVMLDCETDGATIYYTMGDNPADPTSSSTEYDPNVGIEVNASTTIKAIAINGNESSFVASATYTVYTPLTSMQAIYENAEANIAEHTVAITFGNWVVTGVNGASGSSNQNTAFLTDGTKGCIIYKNGGYLDFSKGDILSGSVICKLQRFSSTVDYYAEITELTSNTEGLTVNTGGSVTPVVTTIDALSTVNVGSVVTIRDLYYNDTYLSDGTNKIMSFNTLGYSSYTNGKTYDVTGVFSQGSNSNSTKRILPSTSSDVVLKATMTATDFSGLVPFTYLATQGPSAVQSVTISGSDFSGDLTVTAPANYQVSNDDSTWGTTATYTQSSGIVSGTLYIRLAAGLSAGTYNGNLTCTATNLTTKEVAVEGTVSTSALYTVSIATGIENGTIESDKTTAEKDETITITVTPADCYELATLTYNDGTTTTNIDKTTKQFAMPASNVTVNATFTQKQYTIKFSVNGSIKDDLEYDLDCGDAIILWDADDMANVDVEIPTGFALYGWSTSAVDFTKTTPTIVLPTYVPTDDMTLYAVFATAKADGYKYTLVGTSDMEEGTYLIGALKSTTATNDFYFATKTTSSGAINVNASATTIAEVGGVRSITTLPTNAIEFAFAGNNTNGFTISSGTDYLGSSDISTNNKLAFGSDYSSFKWKAVAKDNPLLTNGVYLQYQKNTSYYYISENTTNTNCIRGYYSSNNIYRAIYLFKKGVNYNYSNYCSTVEILSGNVSGTKTGACTVASAGATVKTNTTLTVTGVLVNAYTVNNLVVENGGQLICNNSVAVTMQKSITQYTNTAKKDWYTVSTPVHDGITNTVSFDHVSNLVPANPGLYNIYYYDEETNYWMNDKVENETTHEIETMFEDLTVGKGYLYRSTSENGIAFAGNTNVDPVTVNLSYKNQNSSFKGFNLVGNPFTHDITWANVTSKTNVNNDGYYLLGIDGNWSAEVSTTATIAPMTAFLVEATEGETHSITISNTASKGEAYANDRIMFTVKNAEYSDIAYVLFKEGHGLNKIDHRNAEIPMLYVINNGENFAIADMSDNTSVINLGFEAKTMGEYTISLKAEGQYSYMHLIDKLTGEDIDMLVEDSYTFIGSQNDRKDRFVLNLNYNAAGIDSESDIFAYQSGSDIIVSGEGELQVFDITGRKVMTTNINGVETINGMNTGVYILKLNGKAQKIVVR